MLVRILLAAILAGVLSGVLVTAAQSYRVTPLILAAEGFEAADHTHAPDTPEIHSHDAVGSKTPETTASETPAGETKADEKKNTPAVEAVAEDAWAPQDGWERTFYTMLANMLVGVAFALIITAGVLFTNSPMNAQAGLVWGLGGFIAFTLAPNFGLPPELPGMIGADLAERQSWWLVTVIATIVALLIFAFRQQILWMLAGLVLLIAPHIYGAPTPLEHGNIIPANLAAEFVMATLVTSFMFWLVLGAILGFLVGRIRRDYGNVQET